MPEPTANHERRRDAIADAVLALAAREGMGATTVGRVAAEASVSKGLVQHYFPAKDDLLDSALVRLRARIDSRVAIGYEAGGDPVSRVRGVLSALLPLTEPAREDSAATRALMPRIIASGRTRRRYRGGMADIRDFLGSLLADVPESDACDVEHTVWMLLGSVQALGDAILTGDVSTDAARSTLDRIVDTLLVRRSPS